LGSQKSRAVLKVQSVVYASAQKFLAEKGFFQVVPPVIAEITDPGIRGAEKYSVDFYGKKYYLTSSMIFHKIALATAVKKGVYAFSPCFRKEEGKSAGTGRHLSEFWQIDVEEPGKSYEDVMRTVEELLQRIVSDVKRVCADELKVLGRDLKKLEPPLPRLSHAEAVVKAREKGFDTSFSEELPWEAEKAISKDFGTPFFITRYPTGSRGFYDRTDPEKPDSLLDFDLVYDSGFGEAVSGGEREFDARVVREKIEKQGLRMDDFAGFLRMISSKKCRTAGFGFGMERLVRYLCGLKRVEEATPFPKLPVAKIIKTERGD
jgi:asparaginyl-tRNA synthetase